MKTQDQTTALIKTKLKSGKVPMTSTKEKLHFIRETGAWRINMQLNKMKGIFSK